jgi:diguanylate cyclase
MSTQSREPIVSTSNEDENANAFSMAKQALTYISTFKTPPIPEVYEVWYRYVEGGNKAIQDQLTHAVKVAKTVSTTQLQDLRQQFLSTSPAAEANEAISAKLVTEMEGLQSLISMQQGANVEFGGSIASASDRLIDASVTPEEIKSCLSTVLEGSEKMQQQIADMDSKLQSSKCQVNELKETLAELQRSIQIDPLTGIGNRRLFDATISRANELRTSDSPNYLFLVDLDKFKSINDIHGHATGDEVLRFVGTNLKRLAVNGTITRYGGDEFAIFVKVEPDQAKQLAEEICQYFFEIDLTVKSSGEQLGSLTISIGAANLRVEDNSESWFERADKLLYSAKSGGRNRAMVERQNIG